MSEGAAVSNGRDPRILVVDDEAMFREFISAILAEGHEIVTAGSGLEAIETVEGKDGFDLILMDIDMPEMDGYEALTLLRRHPKAREVPVVFLTGRSGSEEEEKGLRLGAADYITKPISPAILAARVETQLALKLSQDRLRNYNHLLEERVAERTRELALTQDVTILSLASLAETRDNETGNHIRRTQAYVRHLGQILSKDGIYADALDEDVLTMIEKSAPLHDIGKVGVPDFVLLKPGKLSDEEFDIIRLHSNHGMTALETAESVLGTTSFLRYAKEIAYSHHERWDGAGYPQGLSGQDIPLSARLMAVADVYDALISKRVYKPAFSHDKAVGIIMEGKGSQFDPHVIDAFVAAIPKFLETASLLSDN